MGSQPTTAYKEGMMSQSTQQQVFEDGYRHGTEHGAVSPREADKLRPQLSFELLPMFVSGAEDGSQGDSWRLRLGRLLETGAEIVPCRLVDGTVEYVPVNEVAGGDS